MPIFFYYYSKFLGTYLDQENTTSYPPICESLSQKKKKYTRRRPKTTPQKSPHLQKRIPPINLFWCRYSRENFFPSKTQVDID